jgi:WD40 repeat protein
MALIVMKMSTMAILTIVIGLVVMVPVIMILIDEVFPKERDDSEFTWSDSRGNIRAIEWEPKGDRIAVINDWDEKGGDGEEHFLKIWNHSSKRTETVIENSDKFHYFETLSWSPDGLMLAVFCVDSTNHTDSHLPWIISSVPKVRIFNTTTWRVVTTLEDNISYMTTLDWNWDGTILAGTDVGWDVSSTLMFWNTQTWTMAFRTKEAAITTMEWSPTSDALAVGHKDGNITIYNTTIVPIQRFKAHYSPVRALAWNPNGSLLLSGASEEIVLWNTEDWSSTGLRSSSDYGMVTMIDWNGDGSRIAVVNEDIIMIMTPSELREQESLVGHHDWITGLSWSHHNHRIATVDQEGNVKFWKV